MLVTCWHSVGGWSATAGHPCVSLHACSGMVSGCVYHSQLSPIDLAHICLCHIVESSNHKVQRHCLFTVSPYIDVTFPFFVADIKFYRKVLAKVLFFYNVKNHLQILNVQSHVLFGLCTETCVKMCKIIGSFHIRSINKICFLTSWSPISVKLITAIGYPDFFGDYFFLNLCLCLPKISKKTHEIGVHTIFLMCLSVINRVMLLPSVMFVIWAFDGYIICQI